MRFRVEEGGFEATIRDDGMGFDVRQVAIDQAGKGTGILSMRERAELLGGSLSIQTGPEGGCEIVLFIPTEEVQVGTY